MPPTNPAGRVPFYVRNPIDGSIYLVGGVNSLDDLNDVSLSATGPSGPSGPTDGQVLVWDEAVGRWVPGEASTVGSIDDLSDVTTAPTGPIDGQALVWSDSLGQWIPGTVSTDVPDEVWIGTASPTNPSAELWYDESDPTVASPDPVHVGPDDPRAANPNDLTELWFDDSVPPGILKAWSGGAWVEVTDPTDYLPLSGGTLTGGLTMGGGHDIQFTNGGLLKFPNQADTPKIMLYGDPAANGFGFGITSGTLNVFASSTVRFQANSITGATWATFGAGGLGPSTTSNVTWESGWSGTATCRYTPAVSTIRLTNVSRNANCDTGAQVKMFNYPSGFPAPPDVSTGYRTVAFERNDNFSRDNPARMITLHFDGTAAWLIATGDIFYSGKKFDAVVTWAR